jgi:SAM-dependent methyltransferase
MSTGTEFDDLQSESASWWYVARQRLLRDFVERGLRGKREARVLDFGGTAGLYVTASSLLRIVNVHSSLQRLAFLQMQNDSNLVCSGFEELAFSSNTFDIVVAGDILQSATDDRLLLRGIRRVLKDGGLLCLTVPAYPFLWGEDDERLGHQRRYVASELRRKLNTNGFEVQRVSYFVASAFVPLALSRAFKNIFHTSITRDRHYARRSPVANAAILSLLDLERHLLQLVNLPFGTRLVCWARKPALVAERVTVPAWERQWAAPPLPQGG